MATDPADVSSTKYVRAMLAKFGVDATMADVRVHHGIVSIRGSLKTVKGSESEGQDLRAIVEGMAKGLKNKPGIKDVVIEASYRS
ncbi:MAG: hypothetical protein JNJ45_04830 [Chthonomonas sp.]|nr:hypothetical protein [Chthonomonas sp.]